MWYMWSPGRPPSARPAIPCPLLPEHGPIQFKMSRPCNFYSILLGIKSGLRCTNTLSVILGHCLFCSQCLLLGVQTIRGSTCSLCIALQKLRPEALLLTILPALPHIMGQRSHTCNPSHLLEHIRPSTA